MPNTCQNLNLDFNRLMCYNFFAMKKYLICILFLSLLGQTSEAQLTHITWEVDPGYVLFNFNSTAYLIDRCGEKVHTWPEVSTGHHAKLLENGHLLYIEGETIVEKDWDGNIVKALEIPNSAIFSDYEVLVLPNGNYLSVARQVTTAQAFVDMGYDPNLGNPSYIDMVVELDKDSGQIVWQWKLTDHIIQQRDENVANYGLVKDHPELLNMDAVSTHDWENQESFMINGMDYNPDLDQIILSVRKISEVVVIDHSTTTAEAAGHTGGNAGKGGDILYRWGNPANYERGGFADRHLFFQHNPNWIKEGEHTGKVIIFDNRLTTGNYSTAPIIELPVDENGNYNLDPDLAFSPAAPNLIFSHGATNSTFYSPYTSGAQLLPNGHLFITQGKWATLYEFNAQGKLVWQYRLPYPAGCSICYTFRAEKYPMDYPPFSQFEFNSSGYVEDPVTSLPCDVLSTEASTAYLSAVDIWLDPTNDILNIQPEKVGPFDWSLFDMAGRRLLGGIRQWAVSKNVSQLPRGIYAVYVTDAQTRKVAIQKIAIQ